MKLTVAFLIALIPLAIASPLAELDVRAAEHCGASDSIPAGPYTLSVNQLVKSKWKAACAQVDSQSGDKVAWSTTWFWKGGNTVKIYTNIGVKRGLHKQVSAIHSILSSWSWSQKASSAVTTVAYHLITSSTPKGAEGNEIRIWLANRNALPISKEAEKPVPVKSGISLAKHTWNLYSGVADGKKVFTFVSSNGTISNFKGDLKVFLTYLVTNHEFPGTEYLAALQAGTEATSGSATFKTTSYSAVIN